MHNLLALVISVPILVVGVRSRDRLTGMLEWLHPVNRQADTDLKSFCRGVCHDTLLAILLLSSLAAVWISTPAFGGLAGL